MPRVPHTPCNCDWREQTRSERRQRGQGTGRMPGFGDNPDDQDDPTDDAEDDGMFTEGMLRAVACYEVALSGESIPDCVKKAEASAAAAAKAKSSTTTTTKDY